MKGESASSAHRYFWVYVILVASLIFGMVYFSSVAQENEKKQSEQLETELNQQKTTAQGVTASVQQMTQDNEKLKSDLADKTNTALQLYEDNDNLKAFIQLENAFINGEREECKTLITKVKSDKLPSEYLDTYNKIASEIKG